mgnify:CR=1 FL=1
MQIKPQTGLEIDGFTLGDKLHTGGFATIWEVTHPLYRTPMVMKVPTILDGYDGPTIVGFEIEQMIMEDDELDTLGFWNLDKTDKIICGGICFLVVALIVVLAVAMT